MKWKPGKGATRAESARRSARPAWSADRAGKRTGQRACAYRLSLRGGQGGIAAAAALLGALLGERGCVSAPCAHSTSVPQRLCLELLAHAGARGRPVHKRRARFARASAQPEPGAGALSEVRRGPRSEYAITRHQRRRTAAVARSGPGRAALRADDSRWTRRRGNAGRRYLVRSALLSQFKARLWQLARRQAVRTNGRRTIAPAR